MLRVRESSSRRRQAFPGGTQGAPVSHRLRIDTVPLPGLAALVMTVCSGCTPGPDYVRPQVETPTTYRFAAGTTAASTSTTLEALPDWWRGFGDPQLDALVAEGLAANHDLRIATARVDEFAARVTATRAQGLPFIGYGVSASRQRASRESVPVPEGVDLISENYSALLSASWEIDLWGRIRRENEAARADLLATEEARLGVALTLVSATVSGYVSLLDLDRRLEISQATLEGRRRNVEVFQQRLDGGAVSEFEMMQVVAEYETAVAAIPELRRLIAQQEDALSVLVGRNPGPIKRGKSLQTLRVPTIPSGLPSDLIARRPDILQAEQQLVASNALIGAARARYFPTISLTGAGGTASRSLGDLFSGSARTWSFAGDLFGPIFAGGAIKAQNLQAEARREQALAAYRKAIQSAFRDVDDALIAIQTSKDLIASLVRRVDALTRAVELARYRYDNGYSDYLEVLDTERSLFSAELSLSDARGAGYRSLVDLYTALGGDWIAQTIDTRVSRQ